jgi:AcrR family transcriptional regulator
MSQSKAAPEPKRKVNRRGEGDRLREELIDAAVTLIEADTAERVSLRSVARRIGIAATSVYLHFPDVDHLLAAVVARAFDQLTVATTHAARGTTEPAEELRARCRTYCRFGLDHPRLYQVMFQADLPLASIADGPANTPGRASFQNLVGAVQRCLDSGAAPPHDDPFRLASLIWTAEHGLVLARISRPTFPWAPIEDLVAEMVDRLMVFDHPTTAAPKRRTRRRDQPTKSSSGAATTRS